MIIPDILQSTFLGIVQGATEFLPISSSGHLLLARYLFGWDGFTLLFDIILHCATLVVIIHFLRRSLIKLFKSPKVFIRTYGISILVTTLTTAIIGMLIGRLMPIGNIRLAAIGYGFTSILLALLMYHLRRQRRVSRAVPEVSVVNWKQAILIGLFQGIAVIPGVSRAGATIIIARLSGIEKQQAFEYSFLASIPAILGALVFQLLADPVSINVTRPALAIGSVAAVVSGAVCLRMLRYLNMNDRMGIFLPYLLFLSVLCFIL